MRALWDQGHKSHLYHCTPWQERSSLPWLNWHFVHCTRCWARYTLCLFPFAGQVGGGHCHLFADHKPRLSTDHNLSKEARVWFTPGPVTMLPAYPFHWNTLSRFPKKGSSVPFSVVCHWFSLFEDMSQAGAIPSHSTWLTNSQMSFYPQNINIRHPQSSK